MDAVEYLLWKNRYCLKHLCDDCSICDACNNNIQSRSAAEEIVKEIENWSKTYPIKTHATEFFKQYPTASKESDGYPPIKPCEMAEYYRERKANKCDGYTCEECRNEYWGRVIN